MATDSIDLESRRVPGSQTTYYIPNFVTEEEEEYVIRKIRESPQQLWKNLPNRRLQILGGGMSAKNILVPQEFPPYLNTFPDLIGRMRETGVFQSSPHGAPNHVILNEYLPGQGIMPHEDGPSYHPAVATLSLGSHTVFHYYQYKLDEEDTLSAPTSEARGKSIDKTPVLSMLLEPRSLVITTSSLYTSHLHGIDDVHEDLFYQGDVESSVGTKLTVANADLLADEGVKDVVLKGGVLKREVRYSLTCRDVEKVAAKIMLGKR
ncbi:hypothetical protein BXZ70DRAFT_888551 [Cristinia sonorae]|uniref:Fe2OG dioxygenase domain-containing protein n=1 Tax=Cristinia sonorae TaxID=1940300 RepID=A0A8K0UU96_9AGAR|nr:hypothetical protein BXZ70DRAFT_888551 [Cristinia sonorae]